MKKACTIYTCDLCNAKEQTKGPVPEKWSEIVREHPMEDRSFLSNHVCAHCVAKVCKT